MSQKDLKGHQDHQVRQVQTEVNVSEVRVAAYQRVPHSAKIRHVFEMLNVHFELVKMLHFHKGQGSLLLGEEVGLVSQIYQAV